MRWLLALVALLFPPILLWQRSRAALGVASLWAAGVAVFLLLAWGVGAILVMLAGVLAALLALRK